MLQIVKSFSIVFVISAFIGGCCYFLGLNFWAIFGLSILFQFIIYDLFTRWNKSKLEIEFRTLENERIKEYTKQGLEVICPVETCNAPTFVPIIISEENEYECPKCNVDIKIYIGTKTFLKTSPMEGDPFEKHNFVTNEDYE